MPDKSSEDLLREALDKQSVTDPMSRAGLAAITMGESKMQGYTEQGYAHTSNARIRQVFGRRVAGLSDDELTALKASNRNFFNWVYGAQFEHIHHLGNTQPDDGLNFRGRGFIQLTGRANYTRYSHKIGRPDILVNPDLANDPEIAAQLAVAYILDRYHGGGFEALMASVGNNTSDIAATKRTYFAKFMTNGEFAVATGGSGEPDRGSGESGSGDHRVLRLHDKGAPVKALQEALIAAGFDCGPRGADGEFGGDTEVALAAFQGLRGLPMTSIADAATLAALGLAT